MSRSLNINCLEQVVVYTLVVAVAASIVIEISVVAAAPNAKQKPKANAIAKAKKKPKQNKSVFRVLYKRKSVAYLRATNWMGHRQKV